ncbi:MAG TPA: succinate dehydrogenase, hydrophobic membrane anchor protein [Coxiellaceae bacterium]|nr:succinate dehydrogenase, hydrophobic membrane anchor protein [Coxiellaceae bacterium]
MVESIGCLGRNGLSAWVIQRISSVIIGLYALFLIAFFVCHPELNYEQWTHLFSCEWMKIATILVLLSLVAHAWIGLWTVITDYVKCTILRFILEIGLILGLLAYIVWGVRVLWG